MTWNALEVLFYYFHPVCNLFIMSNDGLLTVIQKEMELMQV